MRTKRPKRALRQPDCQHQREQRSEEKRDTLHAKTSLLEKLTCRRGRVSPDLPPRHGVISAQNLECGHRDDDGPAWTNEASHFANHRRIRLETLHDVERRREVECS